MTEPDTKLEAYQEIKESGEDKSLRWQVARKLVDSPKTTHEIVQQFDSKSANAIRPRVNELVRMDCVRKSGRRTNPSGHEAYVNHLTATGWQYLQGRADPDPDPTVSQLKSEVAETAREFLREEADRTELAVAVERLDAMKDKMDPHD